MRLGVLIRKQIGLFSMMAALVLFFAACQGSEQSGPASVHLTLKPTASKPGAAKTASAPAPAGITSVRVDVTGPEMTPISTQVPVNSDQEAVVQMEVPPGPARRFLVTAFDTEGAPRYSGEQTADLVPGASVNLTIEMVSLDVSPGPTIQISPHTAVVPKDGSQRFSVTGADPSQVQFEVTSTVGNDPEQVGSIATDGDYSPPATILTDGSTPIGNPIPVTVTAINSAAPTDRDSATVRLTTGLHLTFDQNRRVTPSFGFISTESSGQRNIAFHDGKVYVVWADCPEGCFDILFSETSDGINWTEPVFVASNQSGLSNPSLAVGPDGSIYVAYVDCLFCSISTTVQLAVRPPRQTAFVSRPLTIIGTNPQDTTVAVSQQGTVYVAWSANQGRSLYDILLQRIDKNGNLIDALPKDLTAENGAFNEMQPALAIGEGDDIFLTWQVSENSTEIAMIASLDGGNTFLQEVRINDTTDPFAGVFHPSLTAGPQRTVYVVWEKDTCSGDNCFAVFYNIVKIGSSGLEFQEENPVGFAVDSSRRQNSPSIASDDAGAVYIAFHETLSGFDSDGIFLAKSSDGAATFTYSRIDDPPSDTVTKSSPSLAVDSAGRAFAIWNDRRLGGTTQQTDIFFAKGE